MTKIQEIANNEQYRSVLCVSIMTYLGRNYRNISDLCANRFLVRRQKNGKISQEGIVFVGRIKRSLFFSKRTIISTRLEIQFCPLLRCPSRVTFQDSLINGSNIWKKHFQYPNNLGAKFSGNILRCFITTSVLIYGFKSTIFKCVCGIKNAWGISHVWTLMLHMEETLLQSEVCLSLLLLLVNFLLDFHLRTYFQFGL